MYRNRCGRSGKHRLPGLGRATQLLPIFDQTKKTRSSDRLNDPYDAASTDYRVYYLSRDLLHQHIPNSLGNRESRHRKTPQNPQHPQALLLWGDLDGLNESLVCQEGHPNLSKPRRQLTNKDHSGLSCPRSYHRFSRSLAQMLHPQIKSSQPAPALP